MRIFDSMYQSKLITLLKTFTPQELKRLEDYLYSPIHTQSVRCQQLFEAIKPYFGDFENIGLQKERIFTQLFPQKKKMDNSLSVLMAQLTKLVQDFLIFLQFEQDKGQQAHWLLKSMLERNLDKYFLRTWKSCESEHSNAPEKQMQFYYHQYLLTQNLFGYHIGHSKQLDKIEIDSLLHDLDLFHLIGQLKYYGAWANIRQVVPQKTTVEIPLEVFNQIIEEHQWQHIPLVQLYHNTLMLLAAKKNEPYFFRLKSFLQSPSSNEISSIELHEAYTQALNYCNKKIIRGEEAYRQEMFDLYKGMIAQNLLQSGSILSHRKLKNIVTLGLQFSEIKWTTTFLQNHLPYIQHHYKEVVEHFNLGAIYFYQQEYKKAMPHLLQVNNFDVYYAIDARALLLKIYYEEEQTHELLDLEKSFKSFVRNQKNLSKNRQKAYLHFTKLLTTLYRIKHKQLKSRKSLEGLKKDLEATKTISDKQWLMNKIVDLEK